MAMCGPATELKIEVADLRAALRHAYDNREETRRKGERSSAFVHREFTWDQAVAKMVGRLHVLTTAALQEVAEWEQLALILPQVPADVLGLRVHVSDVEQESGQNGWHGEVRVFRNRNGLVFECRGAERVTPSIRRLGGRILDVPLTVRRGPASDLQQLKLRSRLHRDLIERSRDAEALWSLGIAHARAGDFFHAKSFCHDCLNSVEPTAPLHRDALTLLVECYRRTGDEYRAAEFAARLQALPGGVS